MRTYSVYSRAVSTSSAFRYLGIYGCVQCREIGSVLREFRRIKANTRVASSPSHWLGLLHRSAAQNKPSRRTPLATLTNKERGGRGEKLSSLVRPAYRCRTQIAGRREIESDVQCRQTEVQTLQQPPRSLSSYPQRNYRCDRTQASERDRIQLNSISNRLSATIFRLSFRPFLFYLRLADDENLSLDCHNRQALVMYGNRAGNTIFPNMFIYVNCVVGKIRGRMVHILGSIANIINSNNSRKVMLIPLKSYLNCGKRIQYTNGNFVSK